MVLVDRTKETQPPRAAAVALIVVAALLMTLGISTAIAPPVRAVIDCPDLPTIYPEDHVVPGLEATGYTVIEGTTQVPFDVTVLGVQANLILPGHDLYEIQVTGPESFLDATGGIVAGMSGSPVYVNVHGEDQLLGAVSWVYYYGDHTIGFLTPGQDMVDLFAYPNTPLARASLPGSVEVGDPLRKAAADALGVDASAIPETAEAIPLPMGISGVSPELIQRLNEKLEQRDLPGFPSEITYAAPSGPASPDVVRQPIQPGDPFVGLLSTGDVSAWGGGTATAVCGRRTVAFGHPFYFDGRTSYGEADASVLTVVKDPSEVWGGFKEMVPGNLHGTVIQDRFAGVVGKAGLIPTAVPVTTRFRNPDIDRRRRGETDILFQGEPYAVPDLTWYHVFGNLDSVFDEEADGTLSIRYTISGLLADGTPWTVTNRNMAYNSYWAAEAAYKMVWAMYDLSYNRFEPITYTGVTASGTITQQDLEGRISKIRSASPLNPKLQTHRILKARPGDTITLEVSFELPNGHHRTGTLTMKVPRGAKGFEKISLRGGKERTYFSTRGIDSFDELIRMLNGGEHPNDLIATGLGRTVSREQQVVVQGHGYQVVRIVR